MVKKRRGRGFSKAERGEEEEGVKIQILCNCPWQLHRKNSSSTKGGKLLSSSFKAPFNLFQLRTIHFTVLI